MEEASRRVRDVLERDLLPEEHAAWVRMTQENRLEALRRIDVLRRWEDPEDPLTTEAAAREFGRSIDQFYRISAQWRRARSILSVGASAARSTERTSRLDPKVVNMLQANVTQVVRKNVGASVSALSDLLVAASGIEPDQLPSPSTVRTIVDREILRSEAEQELGRQLRFDVTAMDIEGPSGERYLLFALLDVGSAMILGHSLGQLDGSLEAYRRTASDARARIALPPFANLRWSAHTAGVDLVCGLDERECVSFLRSYPLARDRAQLRPAIATRRFGRHFRRIIGPRLGRIRLRSASPGNGVEEATMVLPPVEAERYVSLEIDAHNRDRVEEYAGRRRRAPAQETIRVLDFFASPDDA